MIMKLTPSLLLLAMLLAGCVTRQAAEILPAFGAQLVYREVADLAHVYPRDENAALVEWFFAS